MRRTRLAAAVVLILIAAAGTASAQCVSEVREIFSRSGSNSLVAGPFAWSGQMLLVASNQVSNKSVWVSFFSESGDQLYPSLKVPSSEDSVLIDVVWNGVEFGVFYETADHRFILRRVSTTGEFVGAGLEPLSRNNFRLGDTDEMDIIWSTKHGAYVIARTVNTPSSAVRLTIIDRFGAVRSDEPVAPTAPDSLVRVDITGTGTLGVFYEQEGTRHIMLAPFAEDDLNLIRKVWPVAGEDLVIDARATDFVLARTLPQSDGRKAIRWKIVDTDGREVREEARLVLGTGKDVKALSLMARGDEIILAYLDSRDGFDTQVGNYRLLRVNTEGETLNDTYFAAVDSRRRRAQTPFDFVWTGRAFLTVAVRDTDAGDDSFIIRLCPLRADISAPRVSHPGDTVTFTAIAEGGVPPYTYAWTWKGSHFGNGPTAQFRFDTVGTHVVTLTIADDSGATAMSSFEITVAQPVPRKRRSVRK